MTQSSEVSISGDPSSLGLDVKTLRRMLRRAMPAEAFEPQPHRGAIAIALVVFHVVVLGGLVVSGVLPWWGNLLVGIGIGQLWVTVGFIAHEALHRAVFRSRFWEDLLGWLGFSVWLVSPGLWRGWHVAAHHGSTNRHGHDPDMLDRVDDFRTSRVARLVYAVTPGSGYPLSYVSPLFLFTLQGQLFLWYYSGLPEYRKIRMNRKTERILSVLIGLCWIGLGVALGPWNALWLILVPMAVSNATLMAYISTNHWLRPATPDRNDPFRNASSVLVAPIWDFLHVNFSYHQEHHIFPQMSPRYAPLLREHLRQLAPECVNTIRFFSAILALYRRPPLYATDVVFSTPDGSRTVLVDSGPSSRSELDPHESPSEVSANERPRPSGRDLC